MIKVLTGDIFQSQMQTKVNTVNCVGVMGKGIALLFKQQYPEMYEDYRDRCQNDEIEEGVPYLFENLFGEKIINFPTKGHWKNLSNIEKIERGLDIFIENYKEWGIESIAFPPLGCGNGGLLWQEVGPIMYKKLSQLDIPVEIYAPFGTNKKYLRPEFLLSTPDKRALKPIIDREIPLGWVAILEVIHRLEDMIYSTPVGKIVFQKICYLAGLTGLETKLTFSRGKYGPYSKDINRMFIILGRENYLKESKIGAHSRFTTGVAYPKLKSDNELYLAENEHKIDMLVDLFSRIKSAEHAEEIGTIMFAVDDLTTESELASEMDFYEYIMKWKKDWDTDEKRESVAESIRHLAQKDWLKLSFSEELPIADF